MRFSCEHCGRLLSVPGGQAGRKGQCPRCKKTVTIPATLAEEAVTQTDPVLSETVVPPKSSARDPLLFDVPPADVTPQTAEEAYEKLRALGGEYLLRKREEPPKRPLPWIIDIFLYPLSKSGLMILLIGVGLPLFVRVLAKLGGALSLAFPAALILWVPLIVLHWVALLMSLLYTNWYVAECIRDSASGGIRAVDTTGSTPGFAELFAQALTVLVCAAACMAPAILYARSYGSDTIFWILYGVGGFLFPMALLEVTMSETFRALNPVLLLGSMFSTLLPYFALAAFCYTFWLFPSRVIRHILGESWILAYLFLFLSFYQALVLAHLVGRFCLRNEEKLNWDA